MPKQWEASCAATGGMAPTELSDGRPQTAPCGSSVLTLPQTVWTCAGPAAHYSQSSGSESVGVSGGVTCLSLALALAPNITGHHQKGRNPTLMGWKGGWFGSKRILEGNIQAKGKAYDTYGGWGRRQGIERTGVEVMVWTCIGEITVRIYEVFHDFPRSVQGNARVVPPLFNPTILFTIRHSEVILLRSEVIQSELLTLSSNEPHQKV
jgi:hypothetical protein